MALSGLLALLDDITSVLDDVSTLSQIAAEKTGKITEHDLTEVFNKRRQIDPKHEISVIMAVAKGALKNKILYFIPSTFAIAVFAPWAITPLSLGSGAYIAYEGTKKILEQRDPAKAEKRHQNLITALQGGKETVLRYEKDMIAQAIKTDAALSLELSGFQLGMVAGAPLLATLATLTTVSIGATSLMYGAIIGIIKMDDVALHLSEKQGDGLLQKQQRAIGRMMLKLAAPVLKTITGVGMAAMFYVSGRLMAAHIPGVEPAFHAMAEAISTNSVADRFIQIATTIATGIAGGVITLEGVKATEKPVKYMRGKAALLYDKTLAGPLSKLGDTLRKIRENLFSRMPSISKKATKTQSFLPSDSIDVSTVDSPCQSAPSIMQENISTNGHSMPVELEPISHKGIQATFTEATVAQPELSVDDSKDPDQKSFSAESCQPEDNHDWPAP